jgi:hypothetical protein
MIKKEKNRKNSQTSGRMSCPTSPLLFHNQKRASTKQILHPFAESRSARNPRHPHLLGFDRAAHGRRRRARLCGGRHGVPAIAGATRDAGDAEAEAAGPGVAGVEGHLRRPRGRGEAAAVAVQGGGGRARPPPPPRPRLPPVLAQRPRPRRRARGDSILPPRFISL